MQTAVEGDSDSRDRAKGEQPSVEALSIGDRRGVAILTFFGEGMARSSGVLFVSCSGLGWTWACTRRNAILVPTPSFPAPCSVVAPTRTCRVRAFGRVTGGRWDERRVSCAATRTIATRPGSRNSDAVIDVSRGRPESISPAGGALRRRFAADWKIRQITVDGATTYVRLAHAEAGLSWAFVAREWRVSISGRSLPTRWLRDQIIAADSLGCSAVRSEAWVANAGACPSRACVRATDAAEAIARPSAGWATARTATCWTTNSREHASPVTLAFAVMRR